MLDQYERERKLSALVGSANNCEASESKLTLQKDMNDCGRFLILLHFLQHTLVILVDGRAEQGQFGPLKLAGSRLLELRNAEFVEVTRELLLLQVFPTNGDHEIAWC